MQKTYLPKQGELELQRQWHHFDADGKILGRLASRIAILLCGKNKRIYTPFMDCGDFVVITNAAKIKVTGNKAEQKFYFKHTGYADGAKVTPFKRQMERNPAKIIELAVKRMLPVNKMRDKRMKRLKVFVGAENRFADRFAKKEVKA